MTNTVSNVRNAYWDYVFSGQAVDVARQSLDLASKLVQDNQNPNIWRPRHDDGSKVERISAVNTDNDGEAWLLTTQDGTRYYFGSHTYERVYHPERGYAHTDWAAVEKV